MGTVASPGVERGGARTVEPQHRPPIIEKAVNRARHTVLDGAANAALLRAAILLVLDVEGAGVRALHGASDDPAAALQTRRKRGGRGE